MALDRDKIESDIMTNFNSVAIIDEHGKVTGQTKPQMLYQGKMIDIEFYVSVDVVDPTQVAAAVKQNADGRGMKENWIEIGNGGRTEMRNNTGRISVEHLNGYGTTTAAHEFGHLIGYFRKFLPGDEGDDNEFHANGFTEPYSLMARPTGASADVYSNRRLTQMDIGRMNHGRGGNWHNMNPHFNRDYTETATMGDGYDVKPYEHEK